MHGPALSGWLLMGLCAATGAYCLLRTRHGTERERASARAEALMGFGMAAMAVPAALFTLPEWTWVAYAVVFGAAALHAVVRARRGGRHLHHVVGSLAMVYMAAVMASGTHSGVPVLTGVLLGYFTAYVLWTGARLVPVAVAGTAGGGGVPPPGWGDRLELARACRLSMGIGMLAMLLTL